MFSTETLAFLQEYTKDQSLYRSLASDLERFVEDRLADHVYDVHMVTARAKSPESLRTKLLGGKYPEPAKQIQDLIGVRIITYYSEQVDRIASRLRDGMTVDEENSRDRRDALARDSRFGYRSVHLVGKVSRKSNSTFPSLRNRTFEVQVRSVLDHAWAEIEHEIVYKSGSEIPAGIRRRFSAVAGAFEIIENEFLRLRIDANSIVDDYCQSYARGQGKRVPFDAFRLMAALEVMQPEAKGWRQATKTGAPFGVAPVTMVAALAAVGVEDWSKLASVLRGKKCKTQIESYASLIGSTVEEVSHLAYAALVVAHKNYEVLKQFVPDFGTTPEMVATFQ